MKSEIYWLTRLDYLQNFFIGVGVIIAVTLILYHIIYGINYDFEDWIYKKKAVIIGACCALFCWLASCFIPSKNDAILIIGGDAAYQYIQKDTSIQKIPFKTTEFLKDVLDKQIKELKDSK